MLKLQDILEMRRICRRIQQDCIECSKNMEQAKKYVRKKKLNVSI